MSIELNIRLTAKEANEGMRIETSSLNIRVEGDWELQSLLSQVPRLEQELDDLYKSREEMNRRLLEAQRQQVTPARQDLWEGKLGLSVAQSFANEFDGTEHLKEVLTRSLIAAFDHGDFHIGGTFQHIFIIKAIRALTSWGLRESKDFADLVKAQWLALKAEDTRLLEELKDIQNPPLIKIDELTFVEAPALPAELNHWSTQVEGDPS